MKFHSLPNTKRFVMLLWVFVVIDKSLEAPERAEKGQRWVEGAKDILWVRLGSKGNRGM